MRRHTPVRGPRYVAAVGVVILTLLGAGPAAPAVAAGRTSTLDPALSASDPGSGSRTSTVSTTLTSSPLDVVSSTGHRLRVRVVASSSSTDAQVQIEVQRRNGSEEHDWEFPLPSAGLALSSRGQGHLRLSAQRSADRAIVSLSSVPQGPATFTTCRHKTAAKIRHVSLSGTLLLRTRSKGSHAWGNVGSAHRRLHFSTKSKVTWQKAAASQCAAPQFPCRNTMLWQASGGVVGDSTFFVSDNKGAHAEIGGVRFVTLATPSDATRTDVVSVRQPAPNQLIVNPDQSATMQATYRGGTVTMTSPQPPVTQVEPCGTGKQKVSVDQWSADLVNGSEPITLSAQVFGGFSTSDTPTAAFGRISLVP